MKQGACRGLDPELFFPLTEFGQGAAQAALAKSVCRRCPVQMQCLAWSLETGQEFGVWGGTTESERRALRREATNADAASDADIPGAAPVHH
jgi:WhiB family redox-sensing transcriptional regulator